MKKSFILIMILALVLCMVGCGSDENTPEGSGLADTFAKAVENAFGSGDSGDNISQGSDYADTVDYNDAQPTDSSESTLDDVELSFYCVGDNKLHVKVEDLAKTGCINDTCYVYIDIDDNKGSVNISKDYGSMGFNDDNGNWSSANEKGYMITNDVAGATFEMDGLSRRITEGMKYRLSINNNTNSIQAEGKIGAIKMISDSELSEVVANEEIMYTPEHRANDFWAGEYMLETSTYENDMMIYTYGTVDIDITENGGIRVAMSVGGEDTVHILKEDNFEVVEYSYGKAISGRASLPNESSNNDFELTYSKEPDYYGYMTISEHTYVDNNYVSNNYSLYPMESTGAVAPEGYKDEDEYGYVEEILSNPSHVLYPERENYIIKVEKSFDYVWNEQTETSTEYPRILLHLLEYDDNGFQCRSKKLLIYENEAAASQVRSYNMSWYNLDEYTLTQNGNQIFVGEKHDTPYNETMDYVMRSYTCYDGAHYANRETYDDNTFCYAYSSKPFDSKSSKPGKELIKMISGVPIGTHRGLESADASFSTSFWVGNEGVTLSFSAYMDDNYQNHFASDSDKVVFDGNNATVMNYGINYDGTGCINIFEVNFGAEVSSITQKKFITENPSNAGVTLENYKSKTPDETITQTYDMVRVRN